VVYKYIGLQVGVGVAVLLLQPASAWAQAGAKLIIAMSHTGNFTLGKPGAYTIVVSNIGGTAASSVRVQVVFPNLPNTTTFDGNAAGNGWSCYVTGGIPTPWMPQRVTAPV
jgi:uncharacterized repeat protein (TIGR01451 family)